MSSINVAMEAVCSIGSLLLFLTSLGEWKGSKENKYFTGVMASLFLMITSDCISWAFPETVPFVGAAYVVISLSFLFGNTLAWFFMRYLCEYIQDRVKRIELILRLSDVLLVVSVAFVALNPFLPCLFYFENGVYTLGKLYPIANLYVVTTHLLCLVIILRSGTSKKEKLFFSTYSILTLAEITADYILGNSVLVYVGSYLCAFALYLQIYARRGQQLSQKEVELARKENELSGSRVAIMLSQIQPHFLYNALSTIRVLCRKDPEKAELATVEFAEFLRGNMDSITADKPVSFEQELAHTRNYLNIEQIRFPQKLRIVYDIGPTLFRLPTLTLQPIVENAVRYGVTKRVEGGTVTIATRETDSAYLVTVIDDGIGYDPRQPHEDGRTHIGISNVQTRLAAMCGGTLEIHSTPGVGTEAIMEIPKGAEKC